MKAAIDELKTIDPAAVSGPQADPVLVQKYKQLVKEITANFDDFHEQNHGGGAHGAAANKAMQGAASAAATAAGNDKGVNLHNDAFVGYTFNWKNKVSDFCVCLFYSNTYRFLFV